MGKSSNSGDDIAVGALDQLVAGNFQGPHQCLDALVRFLDALFLGMAEMENPS